jgi:Fe-S cluster assembly ATPase SufC
MAIENQLLLRARLQRSSKGYSEGAGRYVWIRTEGYWRGRIVKILRFEANNIKRLKVVQITPTGNLVQITGPNSSGKSSILDSIYWALAGTANIPSQPVRKGQGKGHVTLDLGDITVTRKFTEGGNSSLTVEAKNGSRYPSPQTMLDELLGKLTFDPLAFTRMDARQQLNTLRGMVDLGGVDIDGLDAANKLDYDRRTIVNRQAKAIAIQRDAIQVTAGLPTEAIDISELIAQLQSVSKHNSAGEKLAYARSNTADSIVSCRKLADSKRDMAMTLMEEADNLERQANEYQSELEAMPEPGEPLDSDDLALQIEQARETNKQLDVLNRRNSLSIEWVKLEDESKTITQAITNREQTKTTAIAGAVMPLDGLSFGDGEVIYNGLPLDQASDAERLRISIAIAMQTNPKLRVLRIRDGSLLDENSMAILEEMLAEEDFQCWIEVVDTTGSVGVVLEDGLVVAVNA